MSEQATIHETNAYSRNIYLYIYIYKYIFHAHKHINATFLTHIHRIGLVDPRFGGRKKIGNKFSPDKQIVSGNCPHTFSLFVAPKSSSLFLQFVSSNLSFHFLTPRSSRMMISVHDLPEVVFMNSDGICL